MDQINLHKKIDSLIQVGPTGAAFNTVKEVISTNEDAHNYFFSKADERWLSWLWEKGFLETIKQKAKDEDQYSYTLPELQYLVSISEKDPNGVVDIMLSAPISKDNFNPEVIGRFLWICGSLPADQVARVVRNIRDNQWVQLMRKFNHSGFEYEKMLEKLFEAKDWENLLILSEAILSVRSKEEVAKEEKKYGTDNPFYFNDLGQIKIFEYLVAIDDKNLEKALTLVSDVMKKIVLMEQKENKSEIFEVADSFELYDVDFFTLNLDDDKHFSYRDDVKSVAATMKKLTERLIGGSCSDPKGVRESFEKYTNSLPLSYSMWRFRLFVLTLCPDIFKEELKDAFFKFFDYDECYDLILGPEYYQALKSGFSVLSNSEKRQYVRKVTDFFGKEREDKKDESWHKRKGRQILSCVFDELSENEIDNAKNILEGEIDKNFEPEPTIVSGMAGSVISKAPITIEGLQEKSIPEIVKNLSNEWTPENLLKMDTEKDFLNPLDADGMGALLKEDIAQRFELYIDNAELFFDRKSLDEHYTYSFLQGVSDVLRQNKFKEGINLEKLLALIENIIKSDKEEGFLREERERDRFNTWLANWRTVYYTVADVVKELLGENRDRSLINFSDYRYRLLIIVQHLLSHFNPEVKTNAEDYGNDPFSVAINSVRGRAFQSLVLFTYRDGEKFSKEDKIKIADDVKSVYEEALDREDTYGIMFLYGHYLAAFYYRDKEWINGLMPRIFSVDTNKHDLYLAAWEGYLAANIFGDMFSELSNLYERAIKLNPADYTKREYFRELDEGLAIHLALAYVHFPDFKIDSDLFRLFWETKNTKRHQEFVSFVGRHAISRNDALKFIQENKIDIVKLKNLWDWVLDKINDEEVFSGFGFWVDKEQNVFENSEWLADHIWQTLEKSKGETNWDYGLIKSLPTLAEKAPEKTLKILRVYLLDQYEWKPESVRASVYVDDFLDAFKITYRNDTTKAGTYDLINELLLKGSSRFWKLKEALE